MGYEEIANVKDEAYDQMAKGDTSADKRLLVKFFMGALLHPQKSKEKGRPIYEDVEYIRIISPGDRNNVIEQPVTDMDRQRFAERYERWKKNMEEPTEGLPLSQWPGINKALIEELAYFHVKTVEQLANLSDGNCQNISGATKYREKAKDFLALAKSTEPLEIAKMENDDLKAQLATAQRQLKEMGDRLEKLEKRK